MTLRVVDLFSGAGGLALGFQAVGCEIQAAVDLDDVAGQTFRRNFDILQPESHPRVLAGPDFDMDRLDPNEITDRPPDILIGAPPCQGFSRLGRGKLDSLSDEGFAGDPRNALYRRFLEAAELWRPLAVVMENVPGMLSVRGVNYADIVVGELAGLGYRVGYAHLNAAWYGVPQLRERLFFLGLRSDLQKPPIAPTTTHVAPTSEGYLPPFRAKAPVLPFGGDWTLDEGQLVVPASEHMLPAITVSEALDDLVPLTAHLAGNPMPRGDFRSPLPYRCEPHSPYARLMRAWPGFLHSTQVVDHVVRRTPRDYETFRLMKHGDRYPEASRIADQRFENALSQLAAQGKPVTEGSEEWDELRVRFIPPYDREDFHEKWGKLYPDRPSWTVPAHLAKDSYSHIHHDSAQARMISIREAARLQSFPDGFGFCGNMGDCFRQIGNAVPPLLAWHIADVLLKSLGSSGRSPCDAYGLLPHQ
ncbi:hypothetical protein AYO40_02605 [Planctomycetaceae bacterium SCGC AG-212-D15]|nr:hypothetical protein AYO40_02605 [Planctomycetaceae bacterium SCGC AG-212-D15]